jgi:hypothetical protein
MGSGTVFQASDWRVATTELAPDRGMAGEGVIPRLRAMVEAAGYKSRVEIEVLSRSSWARGPNEVLRITEACYAAC